MTTQSLPFTQGGQTQLHKLRMLKQVSVSTFRIAFWTSVATWFIYYWVNTQFVLDILMLPGWGIAKFFNQAPGLLSFLKTFCFFIEQGHIKRCASSWFMHSSYCHHMVSYVLYHAIQGLYWAAGMFFITALLSVKYFLHKGKELQATKQIAGFDFVSFKDYLKRLKKLKVKHGVSLGTLTLPFDAEVKHFMVTGTTGSGKTNAFNHLLKSIRERGDRAVIVDTTGTFVSHFFNAETDKLLNPFDQRSEEWCLWSECV